MAEYLGHSEAAQTRRRPFKDHPGAASAYEGEDEISELSPIIWNLN